MKKRWIFLLMLVSLLIAFVWNSVPAISNTAHSILDPTLGRLLTFNSFWGMTLIVGILSIIMTLVQKYTTNQVELRRIKEEQKKITEEMKLYKDHPEKLMALQKKQMEFMGAMFKESFNSTAYTAVPIILLFRWFSDYFMVVDTKFLGLSWFWFYLIASIVFASIFRKVFKVV